MSVYRFHKRTKKARLQRDEAKTAIAIPLFCFITYNLYTPFFNAENTRRSTGKIAFGDGLRGDLTQKANFTVSHREDFILCDGSLKSA